MTPVAIASNNIKLVAKRNWKVRLTGVLSENLISSLDCGSREVSTSVSETCESKVSFVFSSAEKAKNAFLASLRASAPTRV